MSNGTKSFTLGKNFEESFIKKSLNQHEIAIIELIANSWDAKATKVKIDWPIIKNIVNGETFTISDNGEGMSKSEFEERWTSLGIDKTDYCENELILENGAKRELLGKNGKGRLGIFSFSNKYEVITCKNNEKTKFEVKKLIKKKDTQIYPI